MNISEISPGMYVRFKPYEEIGDEPRSKRGLAPVPFRFPKEMEFLCGQIAEVKSIRRSLTSNSVICLYPEPTSKKYGWKYMISPEMLEDVEINYPPDEYSPDINILFEV